MITQEALGDVQKPQRIARVNNPLDQARALIQQLGMLSTSELRRRLELSEVELAALEIALVADPTNLVVAERMLIWRGAAPFAARWFQTIVLATMALLQRDQRATYRTLSQTLGVDESCLHLVRDELAFR